MQMNSDPASLLERSRELFLAYWNGVCESRRKVLKHATLEDIHDLRVATRRFRAAVGLFAPLLPAKKCSVLKKYVRSTTRTLGALRNIDEAQLFFRSQPPVDGKQEYLFLHNLDAMRTLELARVSGVLKASDMHRYVRIVRKIASHMRSDRLSECELHSVPVIISEAGLRHFRAIHGLLPRSTDPREREARHALRIAIKKWRYFLEIAAQVMGRDYADTLELLKEYQSILGRMNDMAEFGVLCHGLELEAGERERVNGLLEGEERNLMERFEALAGKSPLLYVF